MSFAFCSVVSNVMAGNSLKVRITNMCDMPTLRALLVPEIALNMRF